MQRFVVCVAVGHFTTATSTQISKNQNAISITQIPHIFLPLPVPHPILPIFVIGGVHTVQFLFLKYYFIEIEIREIVPYHFRLLQSVCFCLTYGWLAFG